VVQSGFKASLGRAGDLILDLVERLPYRDLSGDTGDRISGSFARKSGGAGDARVDLDNVVVAAFRTECQLDVATAFDPQRADDFQSRGPKHVVFQITQRLRRR